ncbi:GGDEF domain-containing protein [Corallincola holothuriorum]|nr:sensor domain-containing diguanylate cyclase [Corallincola holothuriorum]
MRRRSWGAFFGYFFATFIVLEALVVAVGFQSYNKVIALKKDALIGNAANKLAVAELVLNNKIELINETLELLSHHSLVRDYLIRDTAGRRHAVEAHWVAILEAGLAYQKLALIDLTGQELVGSYRLEDGSITRLPSEEKSNWANSLEFSYVQQLGSDEKYYPPPEFREDEKNEPVVPLDATIRVFTPIEFASKKAGYLMLTLKADRLVARLRSLPQMVVGEPMMVSQDGYYTFHHDMTKIYGNRYPSRSHHKFQNDYPEAWATVKSQGVGTHSGVFTGDHATFVYNRVDPDRKFRKPFYLVLRISDNAVQLAAMEPIKSMLVTLSISAGLVFLLAIIVGGIGGGRAKAQHQRRLSQAMVESMSAVIVTDEQGHVQDVNPSFERITGYKETEIIGQLPDMLKSAEHKPTFYALMVKRLLKEGFWRGEVWCQLADARSHPMLVEIHAIKDKRGRVTNYVGSCLDLSEQKLLEVELREKSLRDPLTHCWNRRYLTELLKSELARQRRYGHPLAVATFDIDKFKSINDNFGHDVGDQVLVRCCDQVRRQLRRSDSLSRVGGEEFVIVLPMTHRDGAEILIERIRIKLAALLDEPRFTVSFGLTVALPTDDMDDLLKRADQALYEAKAAGRNRSFFAKINHTAEVHVSAELLQPEAGVPKKAQ